MTPTMHQTEDAIANAGKHALYFMFGEDRKLIYVGHSRRLHHSLGAGRGWIDKVATIRLVWFDTQEECRAALGRVLARRMPVFNRNLLSVYGERPVAPEGRVQPGHCPRCGGPKQRLTATYCSVCFNRYQRERRIARATKEAGNGY
jgi:hypothetical protein